MAKVAVALVALLLAGCTAGDPSAPVALAEEPAVPEMRLVARAPGTRVWTICDGVNRIYWASGYNKGGLAVISGACLDGEGTGR